MLFTVCKEARRLKFALPVCACVIKVSVPVAEVVGVEEGRVEILPQKSVEDTDKDFTGGFTFETLGYHKLKVSALVDNNNTA